MRYILGFLFLLCTVGVVAQDVSLPKKQLEKLSSKKFWGRGYTKNGMNKTANYLAGELKDLGLQPLDGKSFLQDFYYPTITFPGKANLKANYKQLKAGADFIVNPGSISCKFADTVQQLDSVNFINRDNRVLISIKDKLTASVTGDTLNFTQFIVKKSALPSAKIKIVTAQLDARYIANFKASNICAVVKGTDKPDSLILLTAHYDHLGGLGKSTYFPGANDNASGTAFLLDLANYFAKHPQRYSVGFLFFAGEEAGLKGSKYFVEHPLTSLKNIRLLFNFDMVGTGEEGATVVNATTFSNEFSLLKAINDKNNYLKKIAPRGKAKNSDHYYFSEAGVPSFFLYTMGGATAYHDVNDKAENLSLLAYPSLFKLVTDFCNALSH